MRHLEIEVCLAGPEVGFVTIHLVDDSRNKNGPFELIPLDVGKWEVRSTYVGYWEWPEEVKEFVRQYVGQGKFFESWRQGDDWIQIERR